MGKQKQKTLPNGDEQEGELDDKPVERAILSDKAKSMLNQIIQYIYIGRV